MSTSPIGPEVEALPVLRGTNRHHRLPPCTLREADLRKLAEMFEAIAQEAATRELAQMRQQPGQSDEQFESNKAELRTLLRVWVSVQSEDGDWFAGSSRDVLKDEALPDRIARVVFDPSFDYKARFNGSMPLNAVGVTLSFQRREIFDVSGDAREREASSSFFFVNSPDASWASGVHDKLRKFFEERKSSWPWLHGARTYDLAVSIVGFPLAVLWANRLGRMLPFDAMKLAPAAQVAILVYVVLLLIYVFRLMFNYAVRVFPRLEGPRVRTGGGRLAIVWLLAQVVSWLGVFFLDSVFEWFLGAIQRG